MNYVHINITREMTYRIVYTCFILLSAASMGFSTGSLTCLGIIEYRMKMESKMPHLWGRRGSDLPAHLTRAWKSLWLKLGEGISSTASSGARGVYLLIGDSNLRHWWVLNGLQSQRLLLLFINLFIYYSP